MGVAVREDPELTRWWDAVRSAATPDSAKVAVWRGGLPSLAPTAMDVAVARGWLSSSDVRAVERQATRELAGMVAARRLLRRMVVAAHGRCSPADVRIDVRCSRCGGTTHGPPVMISPDLALPLLSTATTHDSFVVVLADASIGVDIERPSLASDLSMRTVAQAVPGWTAVERACRPRTRVIDVWTAFEALTKATGLGVDATAPNIADALETHRLLWPVDEPDLVTCLASAAPEPAVAIVELELSSAGVSAR